MNLQFDLGVAHMKVGDKRRAEGNLDAALDNYQTARGVFQQLVEADPRSTDVRFNVGLLCFKIGDTFRDQGNPAAALDSYQAASKAFQQLVGVNPSIVRWQDHLAGVQDSISAVLASQSKFDAALESFKASLVIRDRLVAADPGDARQRSYLADTHRNMGAMQQNQHRFDAALASFDTALAIRKRLAAADPGNVNSQRDLLAIYVDIGNLHATSGNAASGLASYTARLSAAEHLSGKDPRNAEWQLAQGTSVQAMGIFQLQSGAYPDAVRSLQRARDIFVRLSAASPQDTLLSNYLAWTDKQLAKLDKLLKVKALQERTSKVPDSEWFGAFSAIFFETAERHMQRGELSAALAAYQASHDVINLMVETEPKNMARRRLLTMSYNNIGDVYRSREDLPAALKAYQGALATIEWLAKTDAGDPAWLHLLGLSHTNIGDVHLESHDLPAALAAYTAARAALEVKLAVDDEIRQRDLALSIGRIATVKKLQGAYEDAIDLFRRGRDIITRLEAHSRGDAAVPKLATWFDHEIAALDF